GRPRSPLFPYTTLFRSWERSARPAERFFQYERRGARWAPLLFCRFRFGSGSFDQHLVERDVVAFGIEFEEVVRAGAGLAVLVEVERAGSTVVVDLLAGFQESHAVREQRALLTRRAGHVDDGIDVVGGRGAAGRLRRQNEHHQAVVLVSGEDGGSIRSE